MLSRAFTVGRCLSLSALCVAGPASALELPLPPPGDDIVGQVQVIQAKYEDTFADLGSANDLGYLEMVVANPPAGPPAAPSGEAPTQTPNPPPPPGGRPSFGGYGGGGAPPRGPPRGVGHDHL